MWCLKTIDTVSMDYTELTSTFNFEEKQHLLKGPLVQSVYNNLMLSAQMYVERLYTCISVKMD